MASFQVRALYDFKGESNTAEMSISAGEILTVLRTDVGEGWWEGLNENGKSGLFPEAYVERIDSNPPPSMPAPVLPPAQTSDWDGTGNDGDSDDDWENDDTYSEISNSAPKRESIYSNEPNQNHQLAYSASQNDLMDNVDNKGTITKKSLNRFSTYVKSGLESYIMGNLKETAGSQRITIIKDEFAIGRWELLKNGYTVEVTSPKKATKMHGLKSFIAYKLKPSFNNLEVSRRYKHFDWLHDRLTEKFNIIAIPPLPDKQISGRYEDQFIEHRRAQLQEFVNYMCRHPVLSQCEVWIHFLTCTDEKQWKLGKRAAEKDQYTGANFCLCLDAPSKELLPSAVETKIEESMIYIIKMDQCIKSLMLTAVDQQKKCSTMYKREFSRIGESFFALGSTYDSYSKNVMSASSANITSVGAAYAAIGKLYEDQAKIDWQPLADKLYIYKGITGCFPDILNLQRSVEQKKRDCEKTLVQAQIGDIRKRSDVLTYGVFAELDHFQTERDNDLRLAIKAFLMEQINHYKNIVHKLEETLNKFD